MKAMSNYSRFHGKTVLITGSTGGIGQALVERFVGEGAKLVLIDSDLPRLNAQARALGSRASGFACDVTREDQCEAAFVAAMSQHTRIDVAVLNAGIEGKIADISELSVDDFDWVMAVNARGVFIWLSKLMKLMKAQSSGVITITSSTAGLVGSPGLGAYVSSKHAVVGLMKCAALEGAPYGIRVNAVSPGAIDTRMMRSIEESMGLPDAVREQFISSIPLKRYGSPTEIAFMVAFLSSDEAGFSTGATFLADGGVLAGRSR